MKYSLADLCKGVLSGETRFIARALSHVENGTELGKNIIKEIFPHSGKGHIIGVTGAPGAGKSTLVDQLIKTAREKGKKVAVVAVDPSSPYSGGAILGDRIRMNYGCEDSGVFIRSMANRGALGGLSRATFEVVAVLDAAGFDTIIIETVGVGQGEIDIVKMADSCAVILVPGMGDGVQVMKAGIIEIADVFVINKADRDGTDQLERELLVLLSLGPTGPGSVSSGSAGQAENWTPKIIKSVATTGTGRQELLTALTEHYGWLRSTDAGRRRRMENFRTQIVKLAADAVVEEIEGKMGQELESLVQAAFERKVDPRSAATKLLLTTKVKD